MLKPDPWLPDPELTRAERELDRDLAGLLIGVPVLIVITVWMAFAFRWLDAALVLLQRWGV